MLSNLLELLRERVALWLGLGFTLAWEFSILSFEGIIRSDEAVLFIGFMHDPLFLAATLTAAVLLLTTALSPLKVLAILFQKRLALGATATAALGIVGVACSSIIFIDSIAIAVASGIGIGVAIAYFFQTWASYYSEADLRDIPCLIVAAFACSAVLCALCVSTSLADMTIAVGLNVAYLVIATVLVLSHKGHFPLPSMNRTAAKTLVAIALFSFAVGFISQFSWTYYLKASLAYRSHGFTTTFLVSSLLAAAVMLPVAISSRYVDRRLSHAYSLTILLLVVSLCLELFTERILFTAYLVNQVAYYITQIMVWLIALSLAFKLSDTSFHTAGIALGCMLFGSFMGFDTCAQFAAVFNDDQMTGNVFIAGMIVAIVAIALFVFRESDFVNLTDRGTGDTEPGGFDERVAAIARQHNLSKREGEVFAYFAKGRNAAFIQEKLVLSYSTISTHRQNIYAKLGVHTQQELLDLVEEGAASEER